MACEVCYDNLNIEQKCQFQNLYNDNQLILFDEKKWCLLHLPIQNKDRSLTSDKNDKLQDFDRAFDDILSTANNKKQDANFRHVVFPEKFNLAPCDDAEPSRSRSSSNEQRTELIKKVNLNFQYCSFYGIIEVPTSTSMRFEGKINFSNAHFFSDFCFRGVIFSNEFICSHTVFSKSATFDWCGFEKACDFSHAKFKNTADFSNSSFLSTLTFDDSIFFDDTKFINTVFSEALASFSTIEFHKNTIFRIESARSRIIHILFKESKFKGIADFTNRTFLGGTNFSSCTFEKAPRFQGCSFHQDTLFPAQKYFKDHSSADAAYCYRTLYMAMSDLHARSEESMFYALMQKSARKNKELPWDKKIVSWFYWAVSNYGQSLLRPLFGLLGLLLIFIFIYSLASNHIDIHSSFEWIIFKSIVFCALVPILHPLNSIFGNFNTTNPIIQQIINTHPLRFTLLASIESIVAASLIWLFLLALRWHFKRY